jgi:segregation and condensation protein A
MDTANYTVRLDSFEGPLDLLLHLVKTNEVDIYHLPIAKVTDQYLEYMGLFEELDLDVAGEYLVMAATLMYLKSKLLLPVDEEEDEEPIDEVEADLVRQLAEYQRYREAGEELRDRMVLGRDVFKRQPTPPERAEEDDPGMKPVELGNLFEALRKVLATAAARQPHQLTGEEVSVSDAVTAMVDRLRASERLRFDLLFGERPSRPYIIATFIGLLELMKLRIISCDQEEALGPIFLKLESDDLTVAMVRLSETYGGGALPALEAQAVEAVEREAREKAAGASAAAESTDAADGEEETRLP